MGCHSLSLGRGIVTGQEGGATLQIFVPGVNVF